MSAKGSKGKGGKADEVSPAVRAGQLTEDALKAHTQRHAKRNHSLREAVWKKTGEPDFQLPPASIAGPPLVGYRSPRASVSASMAGPNPLYDGSESVIDEEEVREKVDKKSLEVRQAPWERDEVKQRGKGANPVVTRNPPLVLADKESLMRTDPTLSVHHSIPGARGERGEDTRGSKGRAAQEAPVQKADGRTKAVAATDVGDDKKRSKDNIFFSGESTTKDEKLVKRPTDNIFFTGNQEDLKAENVGKKMSKGNSREDNIFFTKDEGVAPSPSREDSKLKGASSDRKVEDPMRKTSNSKTGGSSKDDDKEAKIQALKDEIRRIQREKELEDLEHQLKLLKSGDKDNVTSTKDAKSGERKGSKDEGRRDSKSLNIDVKLTSSSNRHDDARSQAHSTISKGLAPSIAPGTQRVVNRALSMEARLENLKTALERASVLALDKMPKFDRLNLDRENRVIAASKKVLFDTATSYLRRRGDGKEKKVNEKYKPSELTLTKDEFGNLLNLYRPPGQMKLNEKEIKEVMDFCHNNVAELFDKVFNSTVQEVVVDQFGFTKDLKKADRPEYQTHPFDPKGSGVRVIKDRDVPSKDQVPKRIRYRFSRTAVQPPRDWDPKDIIRSAKLPEKKLELEYVMGFKDDNANTSMYATSDGEIVYYTAAVAIVLNPVTKKQKFFLGHTDDISCIALHPSGGIVATGQVARKPFILVWNTRSMETINKVGHIPQSGPTYTSSLDPESTKKLYYDRGICNVAFSSCGKYLVAIGMDDYHSIAVWDWASDTMLAENQAQHGSAPQIFSCVASPPSWDANTGLFTFCTTGINHIKFWTFDKSAPEVKLTSKTGTYGRDCEKVPKETKSIAHIDNADSKLLLTGGDNGYIYMWDPKSHKLIKHWYAHKGSIWTLAAPSGLDTFFSGGDDGLVIQWDSAVLTPQEYSKTREINFSGRSREELTKMTNTMNAWKNERPLNFKPVDLPPPGQAPAPEISLEEPPPRLYAAVGSLFAFKGSLKERVAQREREKQYKLFPYPSLDDPATVDSARKATSVMEDLLSVTLLVGTDHGDMLLFDGSTGNTEHIMKSHFGSLWGLSAHPTNSKVFATAGADQQLCIWNVETMSQIKKKQLTASARCVDISPDGRRVAVGFSNGAFVVYSTSGDMRPVAQQQHCREYLSVVRYSPNGDRLAVGSGDNFIDIYSTKQDLYTHLRRCKGHTSYITQLDWSVDGMIIQSNCGAYEINYWESSTGKQIRRTNDSIESDTDWASFTCTLGFPVMGIFPDASDGTDVNSLCLSHDGKYVITADDFGSIKLFNAPCVVEDAPCFEYSGHSSHVMGARFLRNDKYAVTVGGNDCTIFIWRTEPIYETIGFDPLSKTEKWASTKLWK